MTKPIPLPKRDLKTTAAELEAQKFDKAMGFAAGLFYAVKVAKQSRTLPDLIAALQADLNRIVGPQQ